MAVTPKSKRVVWALSAARCAVCRKPLVDRQDQAGAYSFLGDVAHIHAKRDGGPRADSSLTGEERDHPDNLFLLCLDHHKVVDDHPEVYTVEKLKEIRGSHLSWVRQKLSNGTPWTNEIYNFFYINLPRMVMLAEVMGCGIDDPSLFHISDLNKLGGGYIPLMRSLRPVIERTHPNVLALDSLSFTGDEVGVIVSFDQRFRTKNLGKALTKGFAGFTGDVAEDPHIYTDCNGYKVVMPIDPRWVTTSTAGVHLSSGQGLFSGLSVVNSIDVKNKIVMCSPLLIGHPKNW